ncbi:S1 RNA-binding domain-containing protein [Candidatus Woesebacteria bacterium]|nr:S1 RNA-binding domain-containing protein [Candidatus Woesebacteria bacterium]
MVKEGDKVNVRVLAGKEGKLSLSIKRAGKDPWDGAEKKYKSESKHKGKITRISDFGAFVEMEPGIEGLIHLTKIPPGTRLAEDQEVNVYVEEVDTRAKKLALRLALTAKPIGYK